MTRLAWTDAVVAFWFIELQPRDWWRGGATIDALVRERFAPLLADVAAAPPDAASLDAREHLAAILVFDQFPRHLFRGTAAAFATDPLAVALARHAIARGLDVELPAKQRHFVYLPLMHSEDAATQDEALALVTTLDDESALRSARDHHATIARFGRFPARNAALGRASTRAELDFLTSRG